MYTIIQLFLTTRQIELIQKKEFVAIALYLKDDALVIHIASISQTSDVYPSQRA